MALAKANAGRLHVGELVAEGSNLARLALRDCWLPILILTAAHAILFLNQHAAASEWSPGPLRWIAPIAFLAYVPLYGALYRVALGGEDLRTKGLGGLQWSGVEWRLIAVGVVIVFLSGLTAVPFLAATGVAALVPGSHAAVDLGSLGSWSRWSFIIAPLWLVFVWLMAPRIARLMLGWPFSIARERTEPFAGMAPSRRSGWAIAIALMISLIPLVVGHLVVFGLSLVAQDPVMGGAWPLPLAIGAGVVSGFLVAGVQAPMSVGVLAGAWWLLEGEAHLDEIDEDAALSAHAAETAVAAAELEASTSDAHAEPAAADGDAAEHTPPSDTDGEAAPEGDVHSAPGDFEHDPEHPPPEPEPEPEPPPPEPPATSGPRWGVEPLSPWPHSVLPTWPDAQGFQPPPRRAPLAHQAEPAQPSAGSMEPG